MKTFEKETFKESFIKVKLLGKASAKETFRESFIKAQSAMEYLMTYGWAILIIAVVLGALFELGVFNSSSFFGTACIAQSGFYCSNPVLSTTGTLNITVGQATGTTFTNTYVYFVPSGTTFSSSDPSADIGTLNSGQKVNVDIPLETGSPYPTSYTLGTPLSGELYMQYTDVYGTTIQNEIGTVTTKVTATTALVSSTSVSSTSVSSTSVSSTSVSSTSVSSTSLSTTTTTIQYIYCVGTDATSPYTQVYYAPVSSTGIGAWTSTTSYPVGMNGAGCSIYNGYIYCVGGASPSTEVYYAPVSSTGIGTWTSTTSYPVAMNGAGCSIYNGYIYCVGTTAGGAGTYVYYAPVSSTGIGTWTSTTSYPVAMYYAYCEIPGSGGGYLGGGGPN